MCTFSLNDPLYHEYHDKTHFFLLNKSGISKIFVFILLKLSDLVLMEFAPVCYQDFTKGSLQQCPQEHKYEQILLK